MKIVGPIHFVGTKGLGAWLMTTPEDHILLNTGMPPSGPMIEASIIKLGFKPTDLKLLLTCHAHIDHVGGHTYLRLPRLPRHSRSLAPKSWSRYASTATSSSTFRLMVRAGRNGSTPPSEPPAGK